MLFQQTIEREEPNMKRMITTLALGAALILAPVRVRADVTVGVDTSSEWLGYMNVFELPENLGTHMFGSPWGVVDLVAQFSESGLTLKPAPIITSDAYWYIDGVGGPGSPGNKYMEANVYVENSTTLVGENITFEGTVLSNTWVSPYSTVAFIKDFAPDYSSHNLITVPLSSGSFSITLATDPTPGRHVQYGFATTGPNVWPTDVDLYGSMVIQTTSPPVANGDFDGDGDVDGRDFLVWQRGESPSPLSATDLADWQTNYGTGGLAAISAVPEPTAMSLMMLISSMIAVRRSRRRA
jgi:hypothetical protein